MKKTNKAPMKTNTLGISPKVKSVGPEANNLQTHPCNQLASMLTVPRKASLAYTAPTKLSLL
jgi:hypothetical protein